MHRVGGGKGFTLIELLMSLTIVAILAGVVSLSVTGALERAETTACQLEQSAIQSAVWMYYAEHGREWPATDELPANVDFDKLIPGYIEKTPSSQAECDWEIDCCGNVVPGTGTCPCE